LQKTLILFILIQIWGCTPGLFVSDNTGAKEEDYLKNILDDIRNNNITEENFFIEKADIDLTINNSTNRYLFSVKYEKPDKFLLSIKSRTGIEGARILITKDTLLVNDRIRKRLL
jgi:hypothetical protein